MKKKEKNPHSKGSSSDGEVAEEARMWQRTSPLACWVWTGHGGDFSDARWISQSEARL